MSTDNTCACGCGLRVATHRGRQNRYIHNHHTKGKSLVERKICQLCNARFYAPPALMRRGGGKFCSTKCYSKYRSMHPESWPQTRTRRGTGGRRLDLQNRYFRSSWEANWARYLNWLVLHGEIKEWFFEPDTFEFPVKRGSRFYTPDFKVVDKNGAVEYHEIKGWMDQRSATKIKRMRKYYPNTRLLLIEQRAYYEVASKIGPMIPNWEMVRGSFARKKW